MAKKTKIVVQVDPNSPNTLYLRGEGLSQLSWEKGLEMKHSKADEWIFETDEVFADGQFKVLINDQTFELGDNHPLFPGASVRINPKFPD